MTFSAPMNHRLVDIYPSLDHVLVDRSEIECMIHFACKQIQDCLYISVLEQQMH